MSGKLLLLLAVPAFLLAEDLWKDHNPYAGQTGLLPGAVLRLVVHEPVLVEYEYEETADSKATIKIVPDKKVADFLSDASSDQSQVGSRKAKVRAKTALRLELAVIVRSVDGELATISGQKSLIYENGRAQQLFSVSGKVHRRDVSGDRTIRSAQVADLELLVSGAPLPFQAGLTMKQGDDGQPRAELSREEKERILLEHLNRILGGLK
ncbi:MAG: flagellar basal body L-ring protein FlgH [Spirochaetales bacterium]|nr:flagellar basal body L-ring protein FlgH [Spirochaetales bacterium]